MTTKLNCSSVRIDAFPQTSKFPTIIDKNLLFVRETPLLGRHPSVENLFENLENNQNHEEEKLSINLKKKHSKVCDFKINITDLDNPLIEQKEVFFLQQNQTNREIFPKANNDIFPYVKPLNYSFTLTQKKFDKEITQCIKRGEQYEFIQNKFDPFLINKINTLK